MKKRVFGGLVALLMLNLIISSKVNAQSLDPNTLTELYKKNEAVTFVPWELLAAVDQVERRSHRLKGYSVGISFEPKLWVGALNPNLHDVSPFTISLFNGIGKDGDGDGRADPNDPEDVLFTMADYLSTHGCIASVDGQSLEAVVRNEKTAQIIDELALIYHHFGTIDLGEHNFPIPLNRNYDYVHNWGARRGWGGRRTHEGTDIFANYGTAVLSTTYGIVEMKGWNKYGGWRIGIRDPRSNYHYYAHLTGYCKGIEVGSFVKPGDVIGYVGSSGYGPPGTQGKFPPHLHYGIYAFNGKDDYSFDPYPLLALWERQQRQQKHKKN